MKGTIQEIKQFPKNCRVVIDDVSYSIYGQSDLEKGDVVEFEWKQNGEWKNISKIQRVDWNEAKEEKVVKADTKVVFSPGDEVKYTGSLKVKSFIFASIQDLETALNKFGSENRVKFTQTHVMPAVQEGDTMRFIAYVFHE